MAILDTVIMDLLGRQFNTTSLQVAAVNGGSINNTFRVSTTAQTFFCKVNSATKFPHLFKEEAAGLAFLEKQAILKTPKVIAVTETALYQVLVLEWIPSDTPSMNFWKTFGKQLAQLHQITQDQFGWFTNNYMGAVPQTNGLSQDWSYFFIHQRLQTLVQECLSLHLLSTRHATQFEKLYERIASIFEPEPPALLHGDLWSGNFMCTVTQEPVLIDPAVYFGHRSMDLGMTTLFGGFAPAFYDSYKYHYPLPNNYKEQWAVCNLYPLLIHLLLFGKTYLSSLERTLNDFQ